MAEPRAERFSDTYVSFLMRVWITAGHDRERVISSEIQLIQSGETREFVRIEDALEFLKVAIERSYG
jgi:hypothetical protein